MEDRWEGIVGLLGSESFPEFLRVFWNSRNKLVRKADLFKVIRDEIRDRAKAFELIRDMDRDTPECMRHCAIHKMHPGQKTSATAWLSCKMFNVRQPMALLLTAFDRFAENNRRGFIRLLRAIAAVSFRYNVICSRQSNEQEVVYNNIAVELSSRRINDVATASCEAATRLS